jgi:hypothetical protein
LSYHLISNQSNGGDRILFVSCSAYIDLFGNSIDLAASPQTYFKQDKHKDVPSNRACQELLSQLFPCSNNDMDLIMKKAAQHLEKQQQWIDTNIELPTERSKEPTVVVIDAESIPLFLEAPSPNMDCNFIESEEVILKPGRVDLRNLMDACFFCSAKGNPLMNHPFLLLLICAVPCELNKFPLLVIFIEKMTYRN